MLIIQRYLFREVSQSFAAVLLVLLLIFTSHRFVRFVTEAAAGRLSSDLIFQLLILKVAASIAILLPLALFIGMLLGLGRLHQDNEIIAMSAGGVGVASLTRYVVGFSGAVAVFTLLFAVFLGPRLILVEEQVFARARGQAEITGIIPGRFKSFGGGNQVIYVEGVSADQRQMLNVFVQLTHGKERQILTADRAYQTVIGNDGDRFVVLEDGYRYEGRPGRSDFAVTRFAKHGVRIDRIGSTTARNRLDAKSTAELWRSDAPDHAAELQWRLSLPLSVLLLGTLAVPLARTSPRQGRYAKLLIAIVIYFAYSNSLGIAQKYIQNGSIHPWVGVWPVHFILALVTSWLLLGEAARRDIVRWLCGGWRRRDEDEE